MKSPLSKWFSTRQSKLGRGLPFHWGGGEILLAAILLIGILSLGSGMVGNWINAAGDDGTLKVSLHSLSEADYSVDEIIRSVPAIGLDIIRDILGINSTQNSGRSPEIAEIIPITPTPTPTIGIIGSTPSSTTETSDIPVGATATKKPNSTTTSVPQKTETPTSLPNFNATSTPTWTSVPPRATNTQAPSPTPKKISTSTIQPTLPAPSTEPTLAPSNTPLPAPTNTPNPTPVPPAQSSPTPQPTRSYVITPTAKYTPGITSEPPAP